MGEYYRGYKGDTGSLDFGSYDAFRASTMQNTRVIRLLGVPMRCIKLFGLMFSGVAR